MSMHRHVESSDEEIFWSIVSEQRLDALARQRLQAHCDQHIASNARNTNFLGGLAVPESGFEPNGEPRGYFASIVPGKKSTKEQLKMPLGRLAYNRLDSTTHSKLVESAESHEFHR